MEKQESQQKIPLIVIVGPTASGKSKLAVALAHWLQTEIVSADSMQIYRGMQIGTAKPIQEEMEGIPHHMIDFLEPDEPFSVADYVARARVCVEAIAGKGKIPIMAGGTGLYIDAFLHNLQFSEQERDMELCRHLEEKAQTQGVQALAEELRTFDPQSAQRIDPRNVSRLVRAIEIYRTTGMTMTEHMERSRQIPSPYTACIIGLDYADRAVLYDRINRRVDQMLRMGLVEEARRVLSRPGGKTALQAIGYKELLPYFQGSLTLQEAVELMKRETRRYAKRQLTWFRRNPDIYWLKADEEESWEQLTEKAKGIIAGFRF